MGLTTITWTATDSAQNTAQCIQTVTVTDDEDPRIICPPDVNASAQPGSCLAPTVNLGTPTVADNCAGVSFAGVRSDGLPLTDPFPVGTTTVTWTATDASGNTASCNQTVTVEDVQDPTLTCPPDLNLIAEEQLCGISNVSLSPPQVSDNCSAVNVGGSRSDGEPLGNVFPVGTTLVTWTASDANGNSVQCVQSVTVTDVTAPTIVTCPEDLELATLACEETVEAPLNAPTAVDSCGVASIVGTRDDGQPLNDPFGEGTTVITWTVTDVNGNVSICQQNVLVEVTPCAPCADLIGDLLKPLTKSCRRGRCTISGTLRLTNPGDVSIPASTTQFFLSTDPVYDPGVDRLIGARVYRSLRPGQGITQSFRFSLPRNVDSSGMYVIAYHDAFQCKVECDETNNVQVLGQLP